MKAVWPCSLGTLIEWAEFSYYAYLLSLFTPIFFPYLSPALAMTVLLFGFAVSYLARPLGGLFFGWMGDAFGRRYALVVSLMLMGIVTLLMGLLPAYDQIGMAASVLLLSLRFLQGFAVAGEFTGAAVYLVETSLQRPYFSSSFISTSSALGMFLGILFAWLVSLPVMPEWAWRIPFMLGGISCFIGLYLRFRLSEQWMPKSMPSIHRLLWFKHKRSFFQALSLAAFVGIYIYTCNVWWISYSIEHDYFSPEVSRRLGLLAQAGVVVFTPIVALYAESGAKHKTLYWGIWAAIPFSGLLFLSTQSQHFYLVALLMMVYSLINASITAVMFKWMADLFPVAVRYTGVALAWNIAIAVFAGVSPLVAQLLSHYFVQQWLCGAYVMLSAIVTLIFLKKRWL
jgi:MHS family proline/betaine transporter-like MFS transporter